MKQSPKTTAKEIYITTKRNIRLIKQLRRLGASESEIIQATGLDKDSPLLQE